MVISHIFSKMETKVLHYLFQTQAFYISSTGLKLAKNQANAKQHPEAEILLIENYSHSPSR